jgi:site-specific recombinase XerD
MPNKKYARLLEDKEIRCWYENIARGSRITADVYLRRLGRFCKVWKITPKEVINKDENDIYNLLLDLVSKLEQEGKAGSYIASVLNPIKSWLTFNEIEIKRKIKIKDRQATPTLEKERVPTQSELKKIFLSCDHQQRVACALLAHSGLRIEVLGDYKGIDGLKLRDLSELNIEKLKFEKIPTLIKVRRELSKAGHQYLTFLSVEGCSYLEDYLAERKSKGEKFSEESSLITPKILKKPFISSPKIRKLIKKGFQRSTFQGRPYVLHSYFDTQLMLAESKGYCLRDYRTFWMGHKGDIEHAHTTNKGRLPPNVIEDMRQAYRKSQELLQTETTTPKEKEIKDLFKKELLDVFGFDQEEVEKILSESPSKEKLKQKIREKSLGRGIYPNGRWPAKQKVCSLAELGKYLEEGWEFVTSLPENKVIIRFTELHF